MISMKAGWQEKRLGDICEVIVGQSPEGKYYSVRNGGTLDQNILPLPEVLIESYDAKPGKILKPLFDLIWNAFGSPQTAYLDDEGNWNPKV
jgi:hypothetical protein